jgi:hypothetical protein
MDDTAVHTAPKNIATSLWLLILFIVRSNQLYISMSSPVARPVSHGAYVPRLARQRMILAAEDSERDAALDSLEKVQTEDFTEIFK